MNFLAPAVAIALLQASAPPAKAPAIDPPKVCDSCDEWNQPQTPFKLHGRSYYVGVRGLSAVLIQTSDGLILLDGGLPQSAPLIEDNIRGLGFKVEDIRLIVNSHAHTITRAGSRASSGTAERWSRRVLRERRRCGRGCPCPTIRSSERTAAKAPSPA